MKRLCRIVMLASAVLGLILFLGFRQYWNNRQAVRLSDITFAVDAKGQKTVLKLWHNYYDGKEYLFLPSYCDAGADAQIQALDGYLCVWDGKPVSLDGWVAHLTDGEHSLCAGTERFAVVVMRSSKAPALFLTTSSGSLDYIEAEKGNSEKGSYRMIDADGSIRGEGRVSKLKSRGNATFLEDKKPYQMTLKERADLLGSGPLKKYILLANRQDQSLLRDRIMYDLAGEMGLAYSPRSCFVDLYINHEYRGSYQLSEKIEADENRIAIGQGTPEKSGGDFLVTLEYPDEGRLAEAEHSFRTENGQNVVVVYPKTLTNKGLREIAACFQDAESRIREGRPDPERMDLTSFAKKYLVEEIGKNLDAMYTSQYFYQKDGVLYAGPVWDYDKTLGNPLIEHNRPVDFQEPRGIYAAMKQPDASWWYDLYQLPAFREEFTKEYEAAARPAIRKMLESGIDGYKEEIWDSARMDYMRWDPFEDFKYEEEPDFEGRYQAEIDRIREFLEQREEFLTDIWLEGRKYDRIAFDPQGGLMYVTTVDAVEGRTLTAPRKPVREGWRFDHWERTDTGEAYDFSEVYDGNPFVLRAVYEPEEAGEE